MNNTIRETLALDPTKIPDALPEDYNAEKTFVHTLLFSLEQSGWKFVKPSDRPDIEYRDAYVALKRALYASQTKLEKKRER